MMRTRIIVREMPVSERVINGLTRCKIIALDSVGTDLVDVAAATAKGIPVTNCPDTFVQEVAEHTAALILAAHRRLLWMDKRVRAGELGRRESRRYADCRGCTGRPWG